MIPNPGYFPTSMGARADWYLNFEIQFSNIALALGFETKDITDIQIDNAMMQYLRSAYVQMSAITDASRQYRIVMTEGATDSPQPNWPVQFLAEPPVPTAAPGMFERLDDLVKRIRVSPNYTPETGALLGIIPTKSDSIAPDTLKPEPTLSSSPGNVVIVKFSKGQTDGLDLELQLDNSGTWEKYGRYPKSPAYVTVPGNPQGLPRSVQVRGRYLEGNQAVGQYSDVDVIATIP